MADAEQIPGWAHCPTCDGRMWVQWSERELRMVLDQYARLVGGNAVVEKQAGVPEMTVRRFRTGKRIRPESVAKLQVQLARLKRVRPPAEMHVRFDAAGGLPIGLGRRVL